MTKQEIGAELERVGINTDDRRLNRLIGLAEIDGVLCSGGDKNKKPTYALFEERVPIYPEISKEEALALLALKYFRSHSPATLNDFYWWSGLSMTEARLAINLIKDELSTEKINDVEYFIHQSCCQVPTGDFVHLLPSFDEYLISYKDRTAALELLHHPKAFNNWGIFYPVILCNGRIIGNWKKVTSKGKINIETSFFDKKVKVNKKLLKEAEKNYLNYLNSI